MDTAGGGRSGSRGLRAQSETVGLVLVFGLVIAGAATVVVLGAAALSDSEQTLSTQRAEKVLTQLDSKAALVALDNTDVQSVSFATHEGGAYGVEGGTGWMNITITNRATTTKFNDFVNQSLGSITYTNGNDSLAYQGGGVWRSTAGGAVMVSPPEFHFRNGTLTLPILNVTGDRSLGGRASIAHDATTRKFPNASINGQFTNPLDNHRVTVVVRSEYYEAWGQYFEERTDGDVEYDHDKNKAILTLKVPFGDATVNDALAATSGSGRLALAGTGSVYTDNYTSADGDGYAGDVHDSGSVTIAGDIYMTGNAKIDGNADSGGQIDLDSGSVQITGDANYTDAPEPTNSQVTGTVRQISGVQGPSAISTVVHSKVSDFSDPSNNQNGANGAIDTSTQTLKAGDQTISQPGNYYLQELHRTHDTLTLDASGGDIYIGVEDDVELAGGKIHVQGDHQVKVYVKGDAGYDFQLYKDSGNVAEVDVAEHENSTKFWLLGDREFSADIDGDNSNPYRFEGVIYAPGDASSLAIEKARIYGGVVIGDVDVSNGGQIHFDSALTEQRALAPSTKIVKITYLHVTINEILISG